MSRYFDDFSTDSLYLEHYGVKGMKWGVVREKAKSAGRAIGRGSVKTAKFVGRTTMKAASFSYKKTKQGINNYKMYKAKKAAITQSRTSRRRKRLWAKHPNDVLAHADYFSIDEVKTAIEKSRILQEADNQLEYVRDRRRQASSKKFNEIAARTTMIANTFGDVSRVLMSDNGQKVTYAVLHYISPNSADNYLETMSRINGTKEGWKSVAKDAAIATGTKSFTDADWNRVSNFNKAQSGGFKSNKDKNKK